MAVHRTKSHDFSQNHGPRWLIDSDSDIYLLATLMELNSLHRCNMKLFYTKVGFELGVDLGVQWEIRFEIRLESVSYTFY